MKCLTVRGRRCMEPNYYKVPDVCPDFAGLKRSPCHIGAPSCYNQADCYKGEKCCLYPCGGICLSNYCLYINKSFLFCFLILNSAFF